MVSSGGAADRIILADVPAWFCFFKPRCYFIIFPFASVIVLCGQCVGTQFGNQPGELASYCVSWRLLAGFFPLFCLCRNIVSSITDRRISGRQRRRMATCVYAVCKRRFRCGYGDPCLRRVECAASCGAPGGARYRKTSAAACKDRIGHRYSFGDFIWQAVCGRADGTY